MLDLLPPWAIRATLVLAAFALGVGFLCVLCVRVERRAFDHHR